MRRIVQLSNKFNGGKAVAKRKIQNLAKCTDGGIAALLLCDMEDGSVIRMTITSTAATDKVVCLFPGALSSVADLRNIAGINVDVIAAHGTDSTNNLAINCPNIAFLQQEFAEVPTRIKSIMVDADNARQLSYPLEIAAFGLINQHGKEQIFLTKYKDPKNDNDKMVVVDDLQWMQLDRYKVLFLTVGAGREVTLEFTIGERFNPGSILNAFAECVGA